MVRSESWRRARRILCVHLDTLGDVMMTGPALRAVKESEPDRHVSLLTSPSGAEAGRLMASMIRREAFLQVRGFDPRLFLGSEEGPRGLLSGGSRLEHDVSSNGHRASPPVGPVRFNRTPAPPASQRAVGDMVTASHGDRVAGNMAGAAYGMVRSYSPAVRHRGASRNCVDRPATAAVVVPG